MGWEDGNSTSVHYAFKLAVILPLRQDILIVLSSIPHLISPICHFTGKHARNSSIYHSFQTSFFFLLKSQCEPCSSVRPENIRAGSGSYLDEFGWREDGLVGHGGRRYYDRGVVFLLQPLIEHLHMEKAQEAKSAGGTGRFTGSPKFYNWYSCF